MPKYVIQLDSTGLSAYSFDFLDAYKKAPHLPHWKIRSDAYDSPVFAEKFGGGEISSLFMVPHLQGGMSVEVLDTSVPIAVPDSVADYKDIELILLEVDIGGVRHLATIYAEEGLLGAGPGAALPEVYAYVTDHLGTPYRVVDASGSMVWEGTYDPFGVLVAEEKATDTSIVQNLRFPGQYHDRESDLHYNWHRYYQPEHGRYTRRDPLNHGTIQNAQNALWNRASGSLAGGTSINHAISNAKLDFDFGFGPVGNLLATASAPTSAQHAYVYVMNRPLSLVDPWGYKAEPCQSWLVCRVMTTYSCSNVALALGRFPSPWSVLGGAVFTKYCTQIHNKICETDKSCENDLDDALNGLDIPPGCGH